MTSTGEWYFTLHLSLPLHHIIVITNACLFSKLVMNLPTPSGTVNSSQTTNTEATKIGPGDINSNTTNNATGKRGVGGSCPKEKTSAYRPAVQRALHDQPAGNEFMLIYYIHVPLINVYI